MKLMLKVATAMVVLALPCLAFATHWDDSSFTADCEGWCIEVGITWGGTTYAADVDYTVVLTDDAGGEVDRIENAFTMDRTANPEIKTFCGEWSGELCGDYTASIVLNLTVYYDGSSYVARDQVTGTFDFNCPCDEPDGCFLTPGYWKNHPDDPAWPAVGFEIGGVFYTNAELDAIMEAPVRGDMTIILAHHLIAAKLNNFAGEDDPDFLAAIDNGDAMLVMYPLGSKPKEPAKTDVEAAKDDLVAWNERGCEEEIDMDDFMFNKSFVDEENSSWSELKASYR